MNRKIKFRAWDKDRNEMFDVQAIYFQQDKIIVSMPVKIKGFEQLCVEKTNVELMQYTGLKDKNGKKIYEGDIVKYKDFSNGAYLFREQPLTKDVVTWNKDTCGYKVKHMGLTFKAETYEIIGNIYENPELLEVVE